MPDPNLGSLTRRDIGTLSLMAEIADRATGVAPISPPAPAAGRPEAPGAPPPPDPPPAPPASSLTGPILHRARVIYSEQNTVGRTRFRLFKRVLLRASRVFTVKLVDAGRELAEAVQVLEVAHGGAIAELNGRLNDLRIQRDEDIRYRDEETRRRDVDTQELQSWARADMADLEQHRNAMNAQLTSIELGMADAIESVRADQSRTVDLLADLGERFQTVGPRLDRVESLVDRDRSELLQTRTLVDRLSRAPVEPAEARQADDGLAAQAWPAAAVISPAPVSTGLDDETYLDFERTFRGSRDEIHHRQLDALGLISHIAGSTAPLLDLGCGRGEWLEILSTRGIAAYGVDSNPAMVGDAVRAGLDARVGDALEHLQQLAEGTLEAVSAFHFVEHVPLDVLIQLLDNALLALRPGGTLLLETPNPTNLVVGAAAFYLDPTHLRALHPDFLRFLVESRGFVDAAVRFVHPVIDDDALVAGGPPQGYDDPRLARVVRGAEWALFGPQDYVLIARRPDGAP